MSTDTGRQRGRAHPVVCRPPTVGVRVCAAHRRDPARPHAATLVGGQRHALPSAWREGMGEE